MISRWKPQICAERFISEGHVSEVFKVTLSLLLLLSCVVMVADAAVNDGCVIQRPVCTVNDNTTTVAILVLLCGEAQQRSVPGEVKPHITEAAVGLEGCEAFLSVTMTV